MLDVFSSSGKKSAERKGFMEYRTKAAIVMALIFFFMLATVTAIYFGVRISAADKTETSYEGGVMVEHIVKSVDDMI